MSGSLEQNHLHVNEHSTKHQLQFHKYVELVFRINKKMTKNDNDGLLNFYFLTFSCAMLKGKYCLITYNNNSARGTHNPLHEMHNKECKHIQ